MEEKSNEQKAMQQSISPASIETLETQISDYALQRYNLEAALNMYRYDEKNYLDVLALKIADAEKKIAIINLNIQALQTNILEAGNPAKETTTGKPDKVAE